MVVLDQVWSKDDDVLVFFVNGKKVEEYRADPETSLLSYLRTKLRLTGTKLGCGEGGCGACTVMVSKWEADSDSVIHYSVNACLAPVVSMHGCAVTTVEGIGSTKTRLHAVQERLARNHGSQCGFCTPGIVMSMYTLLRNKPVPTTEDIEMSLQGNLCRCTGYRPIIKAFNTFAKSSGCCQKSNCCQNGVSEKSENSVETASIPKATETLSPYDPTQEPIFPPELLIMSRKNAFSFPLKFSGERVSWYKPTSLDQLTALKEKFPDAHLVVGNTEVGIETWVKGRCYPVIATPAHIKEMTKIEVDDTGLTIGASCTLTQIRREFLKLVSKIGYKPTQPLSAILDMLHWFAGDQIRNVGVLGGNIMTASPISDLNPIFMACESSATFKLHSRGERSVPMDQTFFPSYRKTAALKGEVLTQVKLPFTSKDEYMKAYMQSRRREDDIAIVNAAFKVSFHPGSDKVKKFVASFGGMAATSVMPQKTMKNMLDRNWNNDLLNHAIEWLGEELHLAINAPGGMAEYREALAASFFFKFFVHVKDGLANDQITEIPLNEAEKTTMVPLGGEHREFIETQTWEEVPQDQLKEDLVGRPLMHLSAEKQVTGEAVYLDDMPPFADELYLALVTSSRAHARIVNIDIEDASKVPGFVTWVDHRDIPGENDLGWFGEVFAENKVAFVGHVIGAVVADNYEHAQRAARSVKVTYEDLHPLIITIEDAIKHESYYEPIPKLKCGNAEEAMEKCDHVIEGEFRIGGQEHFYLETQACLVVPKGEDNEMEIFASSQNPSALQSEASRVLGIDANKVLVRVKRMGGGFGGKETRYHVLTNPAIIAAHKCQKPVRCMLTRSEDMLITGGRHPYFSKYKVGFMKDGKIVSLINKLYSNAGNTLDLSGAVMERALFHSDNCYKIPNVSLQGFICRTNIASNTAFRGFGGPQGLLVAETWISQIAHYLNMSPVHIRRLNMYNEGDQTHFGQTLDRFHARRCYEECMERSNYEERKKEIERFNKQSRWRKKGISCIPTKFGIAFTAKFMNQAGALVQVYKDGSVLLTHGGTEMGQGLHTKMIQVASKCLGIPISRIHISETSTNTVPNTSPTAASASSDLNGMAVKIACDEIMARIKPIKRENPELSWNGVILKAYMERVSLSASAFYRTPNIDCDWNKDTGEIQGRPFNYFTFGAAVSEVEIDCLTGDHVVLRTDIVMDVGRSINPSVDIGQIEGGFVQGYGLVTLEESLHAPSGHLLARGPGAYKIPGFGDCPKQFNVHLLRDSANDKAVFSSKAIGEPPLFLASSVFFALKNAIVCARKESNILGDFRMDSPATAEKIRMACADDLSKQHSRHANIKEENQMKPWSIQA